MSTGPSPHYRRRRAGLGQPRPASRLGGGDANGNGGARLRRRRASLYRRGRGGARGPRLLRVTMIVAAVLLSLVAGTVGVAFAGYNIYRSQLPDAATIAADEPAQDSYVYDAKGELIYVFHDPDFRHTHVALADISRWARLAIVDVEDRHFFSEGSWDLPRLFAAGVNDITHSKGTQGASTITEQLAKISFFGSSTPRSLDYKIKEIVLGNEIASNFTKDQILEMYMNRVFFGNYSLGIETAARLYFWTDAARLDLAQSAMLAGLPQSPSYFNPLIHDKNVLVNPIAKFRQHIVLAAMETNGDITAQQARAAYAEKLTFHSWTESNPVFAPDFLGYVQSWLKDHYGSQYLKPGGWRIYTTLDPDKQALAESVVQKEIQKDGNAFNMHGAALVSLDPKTGELIDMVGSGDPASQHFGNTNLATADFTPGSTIKLFTYTAAIASGKFTMTTPILDAPYAFPIPNGPAYKPFDYDRNWHGVCELKACLGNSFNMPAVKTEVATGIPYIDSLELDAGITAFEGSCRNSQGREVSNMPTAYQYAATLGGLACGIPLDQLADGAAMIADMGLQHNVIPVVKIVDGTTDRTIFKYNPVAAEKRVVPDNVAYIMNEITSNDANRVREFGAHGLLTIPGRRVSAKTGTGEYFQDNLTVGWTPEFLTAVWVGNPYPFCSAAPAGASCGFLSGVRSGITGAAPIWHNFMVQALAGMPVDWYTRPADVVATGPTDNADFFLPGTENAYTGGCYYWGPAPDPENPCLYTGLEPPPWYVPPAPTPTPEPSPGVTPPPDCKHHRKTCPSPSPLPIPPGPTPG